MASLSTTRADNSARHLDLHVIVAPVFNTNTCILVSDDGEALVVDAGAGVADEVIAQVENNGWKVRAVAATHGHADHTWDAGPLCKHFGVPFLINEAGKYRLEDPIGTLHHKNERPDQSVAVAIATATKAMGVGQYVYPPKVVTFGPDGLESVPENAASAAGIALDAVTAAGAHLTVGSIELDLVFAPGHTEGSTLFIAPGQFVLAGDVLFAGSIGRTDLPGGDLATMNDTLRRLATTLDPSLTVIPGHGPTTTVAKELATNPYWLAALKE